MKKKLFTGFSWQFISKGVFWIVLLITLTTGALKAQGGSITLVLKDTSLSVILNEIKNQADINIVFNHEQVNQAPNVSIEVFNSTWQEALNQCLKNTAFEYQMVNNTVIIKPKKQTTQPNVPKAIKTQTMRGRVLDRDSKISLPFANIVVLNTSPAIGVTTDADGYFKIEKLPTGRYTLQISYVGYETIKLPEILVGSAKEVVLNVELSEAAQNMKEVVVSMAVGQPLNDMATISAKSFSVEETKRYPASISDPARMAQVFAGVSTTDDASNEIVIRGNSPNWMLWRLEGVEIPSPNHFAEEGYTAGAVSILSSNTLGKSDFYTGAFPADYGNALSGVFDIKLRNGNNEKNEYSVQVGVLGAEGSVEGPLKKGYKGSYLINYRYATFSLLNNLNIEVSENALPNYQDLSFKLNLPTNKIGTFALWGIGGTSDTDEKYYPDTTIGDEIGDGYLDYTKTGMYATGLSHTIFPGSRSYIKTVLSASGSFSYNNTSLMDSLGVMRNDYNDDFQSGALRISSYYNQKFSNKLTMRAGIVASKLDFDYFSEYTDKNHVWQKGIDGTGNTNMFQAYVQSKYEITPKIKLTAGLHYSHFALSNDNSLEPRAGLQISLNNDQKIGLGFGMHSRHENIPLYFVAFEDPEGSISYLNKNIGLTRSTHYVASYEKIIRSDWMIKLEAYYQSISSMPVPNAEDNPIPPSFNFIGLEDTLVNTGTGKNYGLELTVQKFFTNNYYFLFTTSLYDAKYKAYNGKWYNSLYNSNYTFNLVGGKEIAWGSNKMIGVNGKFLWTGGKRAIPIDLESSIEAGESEYFIDEGFSIKMPDYMRFDLGIRLHFFKEKSEHVISLDVQNLTNRQNVWAQYYNPRTESVAHNYMAGLIPILSYRIEF